MRLSESRIKFDRRDHRMDALPEGIATAVVNQAMPHPVRIPLQPVG